MLRSVACESLRARTMPVRSLLSRVKDSGHDFDPLQLGKSVH
jgi:hypothetical protein